jgi:hypothetical protein
MRQDDSSRTCSRNEKPLRAHDLEPKPGEARRDRLVIAQQSPPRPAAVEEDAALGAAPRFAEAPAQELEHRAEQRGRVGDVHGEQRRRQHLREPHRLAHFEVAAVHVQRIEDLLLPRQQALPHQPHPRMAEQLAMLEDRRQPVVQEMPVIRQARPADRHRDHVDIGRARHEVLGEIEVAGIVQPEMRIELPELLRVAKILDAVEEHAAVPIDDRHRAGDEARFPQQHPADFAHRMDRRRAFHHVRRMARAEQVHAALQALRQQRDLTTRRFDTGEVRPAGRVECRAEFGEVARLPQIGGAEDAHPRHGDTAARAGGGSRPSA